MCAEHSPSRLCLTTTGSRVRAPSPRLHSTDALQAFRRLNDLHGGIVNAACVLVRLDRPPL